MNNIYDKCKHCGFAFTCEQRLDEDHLTESQSLDLLSIIHGIWEKQYDELQEMKNADK